MTLPSNKIKIEQRRTGVDTAMRWLVAALNIDTDAISSLPNLQNEKAEELAQELRALLDPIINAKAANRPSIEFEENLAETVRWLPIRFEPQRVVLNRKLTDQWEEWPVPEVTSLRQTLLYWAREVLVRNRLHRLRRCALEKCRKYFDDDKGGRPAKFCCVAHRIEHHNPDANSNRRLVSFMQHIVQSAAKDNYDLADIDKKRIEKFGRNLFEKMRKRLTGLNRKSLTIETVESLGLPQKLIDRFKKPRKYEKTSKKRKGRSRSRKKKSTTKRGGENKNGQ
jgi:hypothetical protein